MEADMRGDIFGHYQKLTFAFYDNQKVGHLLSRITSDLFDISELLHHGPEDLVISIIKIYRIIHHPADGKCEAGFGGIRVYPGDGTILPSTTTGR